MDGMRAETRPGARPGVQADGAVVLGIDLGTSSVKVCVVDAAGKTAAEAQRGYEVSAPHEGWREIDPARWWDAACTAIREVVESVSAPVAAIGVTGQMHTLVPLGEQGEPLRPALMWNDARAADLIPGIRYALSSAGEYHLAQIASTGSPAANLLWMKEREPELFARMSAFVIGPDWIVYRLTGSIGTDYCEASTSALFNLERADWSDAARIALGLPGGIFPPVRGSLETAGRLLDAAAAELGLKAGIPVIVGTGDNPAAAIPTGCLADGAVVLSLGTSGVLMVRRDEPEWAAKGKNILVSLDGERIDCLVQGVVQSCGSTRDWLVHEVLQTGFAELDAEVEPGHEGTGRLLFFPHMSGEKTIYADPSLRGAFLGLSTDTTRADLHLAVMEGIAYGFRQLAQEMSLELDGGEPLRVVGGGAKSELWLHVIANVLGCSVQRLEGASGAGYGAAALAWARVRGSDQPSVPMRLGEVIVPDVAVHARHDQKYARYLRLRDAVTAVYA